MKSLLISSTLCFAMLVAPATAAQKVTSIDKIQLQVAMQKSISHQLVDGKYFYFDTKNSNVVTLYPTQAHPMILSMGSQFILCSDFKTKSGKSVNIDFYLARKGKTFVVFDTVIGNRKPIAKMMKAGLVTSVN